ncbi:MAG: hypothetical protein H0V27_09490 [Pyrinomonadaceae bacterium]|nr:hypothetical protein [Pyrinomonadaceae bacterium]
MQHTRAGNAQHFVRRHFWLPALAVLFVFYVWGIGANPPGFFLDESSIAYNAYLIAQTGADEHGVRFPLYFRAFGEYKNPAYVYLLVLVYKIFPPGILLARLLSAALGFAAALLIGRLAYRVSKHRGIGVLVGLAAMFVPWLFEISRLVFEVALFPLALALFLLWLYRAQLKERWSLADAVRLALALALITYTYSIGRLLAPLLAFGFVLFVTRRNLSGVVRAWALYALTLLPLFLFTRRHPGALTARFHDLSYIKPESAITETIYNFINQYINNWSLRSLLLVGDLNARHHVSGAGGSLLVAVFVLSVIGIAIALCSHRHEAWWRFNFYGLLASIVPTALTIDNFHTLRSIAFPVFLLLFNIPAFLWLTGSGARVSLRRTILFLLLTCALLQGAWFMWRFHAGGTKRTTDFEAGYAEIFTAALATGHRPVYLIDRSPLLGYIHGYWYGVLHGVDRSQFIRLPDGVRAPAGSLVIGSQEPCPDCTVIGRTFLYNAFISQ